MDESNKTMITFIAVIVIFSVIYAFCSGCTSLSAGNANATNPVVNPDGDGNIVDVNTESETDQRANAGQLVSGDSKNNTNQIFGLSDEVKGLVMTVCGALLSIGFSILLLAFLVELKIRTFYGWVIFTTAIGGMVFGVTLLMSLA